MQKLIKTLISNCPEDTIQFAKDLSKTIPYGSTVFMVGDLGSGKTTLIQLICKKLKIKLQWKGKGIKEKGYRLNVGIIVANSDGKLLYCKRKNSTNWQFPQGGIDKNEKPLNAMKRELAEETSITKEC